MGIWWSSSTTRIQRWKWPDEGIGPAGWYRWNLKRLLRRFFVPPDSFTGKQHSVARRLPRLLQPAQIQLRAWRTNDA